MNRKKASRGWGLDRVNISEFGKGMPHKKPICNSKNRPHDKNEF